MIGRIVEIADDRRHLFVNRGFLVERHNPENGLLIECIKIRLHSSPSMHENLAQNWRGYNNLFPRCGEGCNQKFDPLCSSMDRSISFRIIRSLRARFKNKQEDRSVKNDHQ